MTSRRAIDSFTEIATLRIELKDSDPPIWRVTELQTSITFKVLHDIVQAAIGWLDYHLWELVIDGKTWPSLDDDWGTAPPKIAARTRLRDLLALGTTRIDYTYDFGDNGGYSLIVSDVPTGDPGAAYPRLIEGECDRPQRIAAASPAFTR
jgi:hypothetical protein